MIGISDSPCSLDREMILDYMEKGFLDNIIDLFKHDPSCLPLIVDMLGDERIRVRIGAVVLVEEFVLINSQGLSRLIPDIAALIKHNNPSIRGDSAYILGLIKRPEALPFLYKYIGDENPLVREIIEDSINEIKGDMR